MTSFWAKMKAKDTASKSNLSRSSVRPNLAGSNDDLFASYDDDDDTSMDDEKPLATIDSIWKCEKIIKEDNGWTCTWCNKRYKNTNEARAIVHLSKLKLPVGDGQAICKASISAKYQERYAKLAHAKANNIQSKKCIKRDIASVAASDASRRGQQLSEQRIKRRKDYNIIHTKSPADPVSEITNSLETANTGSSLQASVSYTQAKLCVDSSGHLDVEARKETLDMAIANFLFCEGLAFRLAESPYLLQVINCARKCPKNYQPPGRTQVSGSLLNLAYNDCLKLGRDQLLNNSVGHHGLALLGDGATIKKMPLFNILVSGADGPPIVRRIEDSTDELRDGHGKTGGRIGDKCLSVMIDLDPQRCLFDCCFFDGASNVQKAGQLLESEFPRISVFHGAEHVISLFFNDLFNKIPPIKKLVSQYRMLYKVFGSGCCHKAYALFTENAENTTGTKIGLIRAAETRMAGYWYCFHRLLRLKNALAQTVMSPHWSDINSPALPRMKKIKIEELCKSRVFFESIKMLVATMYPVIRVLRLSDRNKAGMDKLYYHTQRTTDLLYKNVDALASALSAFDDYEKEIGYESDNESDDEGEVSNDTDDDSVCDDSCDEDTIKDIILDRWNHRKASLNHDFAIVGWMCSVVPEIYNHCSLKNLKPEHHQAFERVARKLLNGPHIKPSALNLLVCEAIDALSKFRRKEGHYANKMYWESQYIESQDSHKWHQTFSGMFYAAFTKVACRVTSKILGIGSAERAWGDVKHLKQGKRSHLGHGSVEKQSIIYGQSCLKRSCEREEHSGHKIWNMDELDDGKILKEIDDYMKPPTDNDVTESNDSDSSDIEQARNSLFLTNVDRRRDFKAYIEDVEKDVWLKKRHDDHLFKLRSKYRGMRYICPDNLKGYTIDNVDWFQEKDTGRNKKYYVVHGYSKNSSCRESDKWDKMLINEDLHLQIRICQQDPLIKCLDENGYEINREVEIEDNFYMNEELIKKLKVGWPAMK